MKKIIKISFIVVIVLSLTTIFINLYMKNSVSNKILDNESIKKINDIDVILVLGCKVEDNIPSLMLKNRLDKGIEIYNLLNTKILLSGDHYSKQYDEVNVMKEYLLNEQIDSNNIFLDHAGINTYDSIYRVKNIFQARKIVIITQKYHLIRALYIAKQLGLDAYGIEAEDIPYKGIMLKNEIREVLARDKDFIKVIFKPKSKYLGDTISLEDNGNVTNG